MTNFLLALIALKLFDNNHNNDVNMSPGALKAGLLLWGGSFFSLLPFVFSVLSWCLDFLGWF